MKAGASRKTSLTPPNGRRCANGDGLEAGAPLHPGHHVLTPAGNGAVRTRRYRPSSPYADADVAAQWQYSASGGDAAYSGQYLHGQYAQRGAYRPGHSGAKRMMAMRHYMRSQTG